MKRKNLEVIKQIATTPCYCCRKSIRGKAVPRKGCPACNGTGFYAETHYTMIVTDKKGQKYALDGDTIK